MSAAFTHPWYLALLPLMAALLWWAARGSLAGLSRSRRRAALGLRLIAVALLVLALAGVQAVYRTRAMGVVFVLDVSRSMPPETRARALQYVHRAVRQMRPEDRAALVVFGAEPSLEVSATARPNVPVIHSRPPSDETDIAAALRLAFAVLPPRCGKRVVLLSDGIETRGDALDQALSARAMGIEVSTVALSGKPKQEVMIEEAWAPSQVHSGEPFGLRVVISATAEETAALRLYRDGKPVEPGAAQRPRSVRLAPGKNVLELTETVNDPGFHCYEVLIDADRDTYPENNRALTFSAVRGKPRLLYVEGSAPPAGDAKLAVPLRAVLSRRDIAVDVVGLAGVPKTAAEMAAYDAVLFSEVPATVLHPDQMKLVKRSVADLGVGFGMIGGENGFGAGGYFKTPIEETLPVDMSIRKHKIMPAAAIVLVMDTSGSTGMAMTGKPKIRLEAEAAITTLDALQDQDQIAYIVSGEGVTVLSPMQPASHRAAITAAATRMQPGGGGIFCRPSLEAAYAMLLKTDARIKHVLLLADADDCDEQAGCIPLAVSMYRKNITTTAVGFGRAQDKDTGFLRALAAAGGGGFYLASNDYQLPRIFTRDVLMSSRSLLVEEPFVPQAHAHETIAGIGWDAAPPLLGYVATSPKPLAFVPLETSQGDPLFAAWHCGLGRSIAFTSDAKAHWAAHWLAWDGFGKFWPQATRWMMRPGKDQTLQPAVRIDRGEATVSVDAVTAGGHFRDFLKLQAKVVDPNAKAATLAMRQTAPGHYEAKFPAGAVGQYVVTVAEGGSPKATVGAAVPFPEEYKRLDPDVHLLAELARRTGGTLNLDAARAFRPGPPASYPQDLWYWLLIVALALWPLDVALRRLIINWAEVGEALAALRAMGSRQRAVEIEPAPTDRLLERARSVRGARKPRVAQPVARGPDQSIVAADQRSRPEEAQARPVAVKCDRQGRSETPAEGEADAAATTGRLLASKRRRCDHSRGEGQG